MNLKNIFGSNKKETPAEYFLAVEIHESLIKSVCWELLDGEPQVIGQGSFEMWEDEESLINGVDASITEAVKNIKPEPHRIIFGLPESWLGDEGIHPTKRNLISKIVNELKLTPIGVVPTTQAIAHFLKQKEGIPPTAILLEIYNTKVVVSVVKLGKVEATEEVGVSGDLARDVEEGLARMEFESLPARFLLTDGGALEDEQQQILSYPWQERLPFIHMPKVEILPVDLSVRAVALAGGTEAAQHLGLEVKTPLVETEERSEKIKSDTANIYIPDNKPVADLENLGFTFEETPPPDEIPEEKEIIPVQETDSDIQINEMPSVVDDEARFAVGDDSSMPSKPRPKLNLKKLIPSFTHSLANKFPSSSKKMPLALAALALFALIGIPAYYFFLGSAKIKVFVNPEKFTREIEIAIAQVAQPDLPTLIAQKETVSGSAKEEVATTGETTVGESASGKVTIFNRSSAPISLKSGAVLAAETGKSNFVISEAVTIASKSADLISGKEEFGKKEAVSVSASKIGAEHNLSKSTTFIVDNYSKTIIYAVAEADFTGGTSRTVKAVDKKDQEKVLGVATDKIKEQTSQQLSSQDPNNGALPLNDLHFTQKKFTKDVGEEAGTVGLDLAGSVDLLVYSKQALFELVKNELQSQTPSGLTFDQASTDIKIENPTQKGDSYIAKATVNATLYQQIDQKQYSDMIKGKTLPNAKVLLQNISGFSESKAITSPYIPFLSTKFLPLNNIEVEVIPQ